MTTGGSEANFSGPTHICRPDVDVSSKRYSEDEI